MKVHDDDFVIKRIEDDSFNLAIYVCGLPEDIKKMEMMLKRLEDGTE